MIRRDGIAGFALCLWVVAPLACAGDDPLKRPIAQSAPMEIPHSTELYLAYKAGRRNRAPDNIERHNFLDLTPGLTPLAFTRYSDVRARILTPQLRRTPLLGWMAENLYRSKKDTGWCLELDPGEGEYVVFYRLNLK
jgi:hypothetical protein